MFETLCRFLSLHRPQADQPPSSSSGPSPSRTALTTTTTAPSAQTTAARQSQAAAAGAKPTTLPANLDEFKVNSAPLLCGEAYLSLKDKLY